MEFDNKSVASSIPPFSEGVSQPRKVVLKLNSAHRGTKAFRTLPKDFDDLMGLISKYQKAEADPSTVKVSYQDHTGDVVGVSDDEDLMTAIEWAEATPTKDLKLQIASKNKHVKKETTSIIDKPSLSEKDRLKLKMRGRPPAKLFCFAMDPKLSDGGDDDKALR